MNSETALRQALRLPPRHKWFSASEPNPEGWFGPHATIEAAVSEIVSNAGTEYPVYVCHGRRADREEREMMDPDHNWVVDPKLAIEIRIPTNRTP
jgi:hypothetical protein